MKIYISTKYKHIIMAPYKCGSMSIENMFQTNRNWDNIFLGKKITNPSEILNDYIESNFIHDYKKILLIRNPFDYIISGFRYMLRSNKEFETFCLTSLTDHLLAIKKDIVEDDFWRSHCQYQPADYYNAGFIIHKLEKFDKFLSYLDKNCKKDYNLLQSYHFNRQKHIPYPAINDFDKALILELTKKATDLTEYNIPKSIETYEKRYNSGELNEPYK